MKGRSNLTSNGVVAGLATTLVLTMYGGGCSRGGRSDDRERASPTTSAVLPISPPRGRADGRVARIAALREVPLVGPRVEAVPGDFLLRGSTNVAVVAADGRLLDCGPPGARDAIGSIEPTLFAGLAPLPARTRRVVLLSPRGPSDPSAVYVERDVEGNTVLHAWIYFEGDALVLESAFSFRGSLATAPRAWALGERVAWGNVPVFASGAPETLAHGNVHRAAFIGREASLAGEPGYALHSPASRNLRLVVPRAELPGFHADPLVIGEPIAAPTRAGELSARRIVRLTTAMGPAGAGVVRAWGARGNRAIGFRAVASIPDDLHLEVACDDDARAVPPRTTARLEPSTRELPVSCTWLRFVRPHHAAGPWSRADTAARQPFDALRPRAGELHFEVTSSGLPTPFRAFVKPLDDGRPPRIVHHTGGLLKLSVPPGRVRVVVDRGFEYSRRESFVTVTDGAQTRVRAALERVVDTRGFLAADLHLHAEPSPDAPTSLEDRVRSLVAAGVEVAVATDHNAVTDYAPVIAALGLRAQLASVVGDEVTTKGQPLGHFNVFPLRAGSLPIEFFNATPAAILAAARASQPFGPRTIVQLNHPRMGELGYFDLLAFDPIDPHAWAKRTPDATLELDAIEVFNGDHYDDLPRVEVCLRDWFGLLAAGVRVTATGNSDSHVAAFHEAGVPRTYVAMPSDAPRDFELRAFVAALRAGRAIVSSGPFLRLEVNGRGVGARLPPGPAVIDLTVSAPEWVDVSEVELWKRGVPWKAWRGPFERGAVRLRVQLRETLAAGDFLVAFARGRKSMDAFFRPSAIPFAFTNPVYVDADARAP